MTPNHASKLPALGVTAPASDAAFPPTAQEPRRPPQSLSLGSFGRNMKTTFFLFGVLACLAACVKQAAVSFPWERSNPENIPAYELASKSPIPSLDKAYAVSVVTAVTSLADITRIAEKIVESLHPCTNIQIFFYRDKSEIKQPFTLAKAAWAPSDYEPRKPGDYTNFTLEIELK